MPKRRRHTPEQIMSKFLEAKVKLSKRMALARTSTAFTPRAGPGGKPTTKAGVVAISTQG